MMPLADTAFRADLTPYALMRAATDIQAHIDTGRDGWLDRWDGAEDLRQLGLQLQEIQNLPETPEKGH